ncbi:hypothetical protein [Thalassotalea maritima]|uniref:hypothetical protein n=1 Tax=Thalassotalea maritima TaxID=3242416 RepID=UPI0035297215
MFKNYAVGVILLALLWAVVNNHQSLPGLSDDRQFEGCDFQQGSCINQQWLAPIELSAEPDVIKSESEVVFYLVSERFDESVRIEGYLEGKDMYMGKIPLVFHFRNGLFYAKTMIGACIEQSMIWQMQLTIDDGSGHVSSVSYEFMSYQ